MSLVIKYISEWFATVFISFIKKNWKYIAIIILLIALIFSVKTCNENSKRQSDLQKAIDFNDSLSVSIKAWKDKFGVEHSKVENLVVEVGNLNNILDSVRGIINVKNKQIDALSKIGIGINVNEKPKIDTVFQIIACPEDSIRVPSQYNFKWSDPWISIAGVIGNKMDSIHIWGVDTLFRVDYAKRKWFLGAVHNYSDISNVNKHIKLNGYKGVQFIDSKKQWNISGSVMIGYPTHDINIKKPEVFFGITVGKTIVQF